MGNYLTLGVGNYVIAPLGNYFTLSRFRLGNYLIVDTQRIDKSFTSSPTTFSPVEDPASAQFPVKVPSNAELAQRVDAEMPRLGRVAAELPRLATDSDVSSARTFGIVGIVIGVLGLVVAAVALLRRRA